MDSSKCSCIRNAVLLVFSTRPTLTCLGMVRVGSGAAYYMVFSKRYTFDALTVVLECAAHVAVWESSNIGIYNQTPKKENDDCYRQLL